MKPKSSPALGWDDLRFARFPCQQGIFCAAAGAPFREALQCHGVAVSTTDRLLAGAGTEQGISNDRNRELSGAFGADQGKNRRAKTRAQDRARHGCRAGPGVPFARGERWPFMSGRKGAPRNSSQIHLALGEGKAAKEGDFPKVHQKSENGPRRPAHPRLPRRAEAPSRFPPNPRLFEAELRPAEPTANRTKPCRSISLVSTRCAVHGIGLRLNQGRPSLQASSQEATGRPAFGSTMGAPSVFALPGVS